MKNAYFLSFKEKHRPLRYIFWAACLRPLLYSRVVQPILHLLHVANGHLKVANSFVSTHLKIRLVWTKQYKNMIFSLNAHYKAPK